jgi:hypothetical protein
MPRNISGVYSLPAGNPVAPNTLIESTWANTTLTDLANSVTDSLDRNGRGSMLAPLKATDGSVGQPGITFGNEPSAGIARLNTSELSFITAATVRFKINTTGAEFITPTAFPLGAAASPSITFTADLNSGLYSPGADQIAVTTGGVQRLVVGATGNVGIGVTSTGSRLNVQGGSVIASLTDWNTLATAQFNLANPAVRFGIGYSAADQVELQGYDNTNTARSIILQRLGGFVGIGRTPAQQFEVGGAARVAIIPSVPTSNALTQFVNTGGTAYVGLDNSTGAITAAYALNLYHGGAFPITLSTNGLERARILSGGQFLINRTTDSGLGLLQVLGNADIAPSSGGAALYLRAIAGSTASLEISGNGIGAGNGLSIFQDGATSVASIFNRTNTSLTFGTNNATQLTLTNVGHLLPTGDTARNLGQAGNRWGTVFASVFSDGATAGNTLLNSSGTTVQVGAGSNWQALGLFANNIQRVFIDSSGHTSPGTNDAYTLGLTGTRWANVFSVLGNFSGNITAGGQFNLTAGSGSIRLNGAVTRSEGLQTPASINAVTTFASLPRQPDSILVYLECLTAEANYAVGDYVLWPPTRVGFTGGYNLYSDATNVSIYRLNATIQVPDKVTNGATNITPANWRIRVRMLWL